MTQPDTQPEPRAHDYQRIVDRHRRLWSFEGIKLPGIHLPSVYAGLVAGIVGAVITFVLLKLFQVPNGGVLAFLSGAGLALAFGYGWTKFRPEGMRPEVWLLVFADYHLKQPRRFHGMRQNSEPERVTWRVILWEPPAADPSER